MGNGVSGLGQVGDVVDGRHMSETPGAEASGESEVLRAPSAGGLGRRVDMGRFAHAACGRPSKGRFGQLVFLCRFFLLKGRSGA
jgi:hypothetical protein